MVIGIPKTYGKSTSQLRAMLQIMDKTTIAKNKTKFAFRSLISYTARQSGVAALRVGGGLNPNEGPEQWIKAMENHANSAGYPGAVKHVWISLTHEEFAKTGRAGLDRIFDSVGDALNLGRNQRLGAIHMDSSHWHIHGVYSRVTPEKTLVNDQADRPTLRSLAREWERRLNVPQTAAFGAAINAGAKNVETWTRLPSFARWIKIAAKKLDIASSVDTVDYGKRWATVGVWYEPTERGGVLATIFEKTVTRVRASTAGFTPPQNWNLKSTKDLIHQASGYQRAVESAKTRLLINEPTYSRFLRDRELWETSGAARASAVRQTLRAELQTLDREVAKGLAILSGLRLERSAFRAIMGEHRADMKERHSAARAEIVKARPSTRYGEWLKDQAKGGDEDAALILQRGKNRRKRKSTHLSPKEQDMDSRGADAPAATTAANAPLGTTASERDKIEAGFDAFSDGPALTNSEISDLASAQIELAKTQVTFAAKGDAALKALEYFLANLPQNVNHERVIQAMTFVRDNPEFEFTALVNKADLTSEHAETRLSRAVASAVLEAIDRRAADVPQHVVRRDIMAAAVERFAQSPDVDKDHVMAVAAAIRALREESTFRVSATKQLDAADVESLKRQVSMADKNQPLRASLVPATVKTSGFTDQQKTELKATLDDAFAENKSWATVHRVLADRNLRYDTSFAEKEGVSYRGGVIHQLSGNGNTKSTFALKPGEIGYGLKTLERAIGPFALPEQIQKIQQQREAGEAQVAAESNGRPKDATQRLYDVENEAGQTDEVEAAAGELNPPTEIAEGDVGAPKATRKQTGAVGWAARLEEVENNTTVAIAEAKGSIENKADLEAFISRKQLEALRLRARINVDEFPKAAWTGDLKSAPEAPYHSAGSRFEHDRLQRALASMQFVDTRNEKFGNAVYVGGAKLPGFYDLGSTYKFTALTGVQTEPLKVAILNSQRRWGGVEISGNAAFRKAALRTAAELGVTVSNADLQEEWTRIRAETERRHASQGKSFETALAGMPEDQQKVMATFGTPAVDILSAESLFKAKGRSTAHVVLRGMFDEGGKQVAVFETMAGRLQSLEITPEMRANGVIDQVAKNGIWEGGLEITSGGRETITFGHSKTIGDKLQQTSVDRDRNTRTIVARDSEIAERNAKLVQNIQTITKGVQQQIINRHPIAQAVNDVLSPEPPKVAEDERRKDAGGDQDRPNKKRGYKKGAGKARTPEVDRSAGR